MTKGITVDADKFDALLKRMLEAKPLSKAEISARIRAEKKSKLKTVQKMDKPKSKR